MGDDVQSTENAKQLVLDFVQLAFVDRQPRAAAERYLDENYIQHNPQAPTGREAFVTVIEHILGQAPEAHFDVRRTIADGDYVVVHYLLRMMPDDRGSAVADIYRVANDRIAEHWDIVQQVPEQAANDNGMV